MASLKVGWRNWLPWNALLQKNDLTVGWETWLCRALHFCKKCICAATCDRGRPAAGKRRLMQGGPHTHSCKKATYFIFLISIWYINIIFYKQHILYARWVPCTQLQESNIFSPSMMGQKVKYFCPKKSTCYSRRVDVAELEKLSSISSCMGSL